MHAAETGGGGQWRPEPVGAELWSRGAVPPQLFIAQGAILPLGRLSNRKHAGFFYHEAWLSLYWTWPRWDSHLSKKCYLPQQRLGSSLRSERQFVAQKDSSWSRMTIDRVVLSVAKDLFEFFWKKFFHSSPQLFAKLWKVAWRRTYF